MEVYLKMLGEHGPLKTMNSEPNCRNNSFAVKDPVFATIVI